MQKNLSDVENEKENEEFCILEESTRLYNYGVMFYNIKDYDSAIKCFKASLIFSEHHKPYHMLYRIYSNLNNHKKAFYFIKKSYSRSKVQDVICKDYAEMLILNKQYELAKKIIIATIKRNPTYKKGVLLLDKLNDLIEAESAHN